MLLPFLFCVLVLYVPLPGAVADVSWAFPAFGVAALAVLNALACWLGSGLAVRSLRAGGALADLVASRVFVFLKGLMVGLVVADVFAFGWPLLVERLLAGQRWAVLVDELLLLAPAIVMALTLMAFQARFEAARSSRSLGLRRYLWLRFRVELGIILAPWAALVLVTDVVDAALRTSPHAATADAVATGGTLVLLVVFSPLLLRLVWSASPLPDGPLRARLGAFCRTHRFRCQDILLWNTHKHLANAGVIGPTPLLRYVLLSDALLERCTDDEVEAIFAHEIAHVRQHHLAFYLLLAVGFICFYANLVDLLALTGWVEPLRGVLAVDMTVRQAVALLAFAAVYWGGVFGFISRRMEQQADLFSLSAVEDPWAFLRALDKLGAMSRNPRRTSFWRHFSIDRRIGYLEKVLAHPSEAARFGHRIALLKYGVTCLFVFGLLRLLLLRPELFGM